MPDLESSIAAWRQQMLAAGIQRPALDELENHLREEITQQIAAGLDETGGFRVAAQKIGQPGRLTAEFKNARGLASAWGETRAHITSRVLGLCWLIYCAGGFLLLGSSLWSNLQTLFARPVEKFGYLIFALVLEGIYLRGAIASVWLLKDVQREQRTLWLIALVEVTGALAIGVLKTWHFSLLTTAFTLLGLLTLWLFRPSQTRRPATR